MCLGKRRSILFPFNYNRRKKCCITLSQAIKLVKSLSLFSTKYQFTSKQVIKILLAIITCQSCNIIYIFALLRLIIERNIPTLKCNTFPSIVILPIKRKVNRILFESTCCALLFTGFKALNTEPCLVPIKGTVLYTKEITMPTNNITITIIVE